MSHKRLKTYIILCFVLALQACSNCPKLYKAADAFSEAIGPPFLVYVEKDKTLNDEEKEDAKSAVRNFAKALKKWREDNQ